MVKKRYYAGTGILAIVALLIFLNLGSSSYASLSNYEGEITMYKSSSCGCCGLYANYLKDKGNSNAEIITVEDVDPIKIKYDVPEELRSCHTIVFGDYYVEGHVPLEAIEKLLSENPDIAGIAMGGMEGMPSGSPGMPGTKNSEWIIYAVNKDGSTYEFMTI